MSHPSGTALPVLDQEHPIILDFSGENDSEDPKNWPPSRKITNTILYGLLTMGATLASAIYAAGTQEIASEFHIHADIAALGTSVLLLGFGLGPLLWAPLSEIFGRKLPVLVPCSLSVLFTIGTGFSTNIEAVLITRFLTGFCGSAPIAITGGALADMFVPEQRAVALLGYAGAVVGGPVLGPVVGGAIMYCQAGWRWTSFVTAIFTGTIVALGSIFLTESYAPALLRQKANRMRLQDGMWKCHPRHRFSAPNLKSMITKFLTRPIRLLFNPICLLIAIHASFVYSIVYLNLGAFPIMFEKERGWNQLVGKLPFLALFIGIAIGAVVNIYGQRFYRSKMSEKGVVPEARLPPMVVGSISITLGLFIIGNTADAKFPWIAPVTAVPLMGLGFFSIFQAALNYLIDAFPLYAASVVAANTILRSLLASVFPPLVSRIYERLGIVWATNMLAFISLALVPVPWAFYFYGARLRRLGKASEER